MGNERILYSSSPDMTPRPSFVQANPSSHSDLLPQRREPILKSLSVAQIVAYAGDNSLFPGEKIVTKGRLDPNVSPDQQGEPLVVAGAQKDEHTIGLFVKGEYPELGVPIESGITHERETLVLLETQQGSNAVTRIDPHEVSGSQLLLMVAE